MKRISLLPEDYISIENVNIHKGIIVKDDQEKLVGYVTFSNSSPTMVNIVYVGGSKTSDYVSLSMLMKIYDTLKFYQL